MRKVDWKTIIGTAAFLFSAVIINVIWDLTQAVASALGIISTIAIAAIASFIVALIADYFVGDFKIRHDRASFLWIYLVVLAVMLLIAYGLLYMPNPLAEIWPFMLVGMTLTPGSKLGDMKMHHKLAIPALVCLLTDLYLFVKTSLTAPTHTGLIGWLFWALLGIGCGFAIAASEVENVSNIEKLANDLFKFALLPAAVGAFLLAVMSPVGLMFLCWALSMGAAAVWIAPQKRMGRARALAAMIALLFVTMTATPSAAQGSYQLVAQYQKTYAIFVNGEIIEKFQLYPRENNTNVLWQIIWPYQQARVMEIGSPVRYQTTESTFDIYICEIHETYVVVGWTVIQGHVEIADPELVQGQQGQEPPQTPNHPVVAIAWPEGGNPPTAPPVAYATTEQVKELKRQIEELNATIKQLQQEIAQLRQQMQQGGLNPQEVKQIQAKLKALEDKINELQGQLDTLAQALGETNKKVEEVSQLALVQGDLQEDLDYLSKHGKEDFVALVTFILQDKSLTAEQRAMIVQMVHDKAESVRRSVKITIAFLVAVAFFAIVGFFKWKYRNITTAQGVVVTQGEEPGPIT